jgi:DNA mismatch repair ATPase MutS
MAVIEALGKTPGVRVLATTHYHDMVALEESAPDLYRNVSMEAIAPDAPSASSASSASSAPSGVFKFPYTLRRGPSFQCIALELLRERELPEDVFRSAIEFKKQICKRVVKCSETESS